MPDRADGPAPRLPVALAMLPASTRLSPNTVKQHASSAYRKLDAHNKLVLDQFTFGDKVYLSQLIAKAMQVPGIDDVRSMICLEEIKPASPLPAPP